MLLVLVEAVAVVLTDKKEVEIIPVQDKQVVHILAVLDYILVFNHLHLELYHQDLVELVVTTDVLVVEEVLEVLDVLLVEHLVVVLVMVEVVLLADLVELLVVGVDTKVVLVDNKEFLNIKVITSHLVTYQNIVILMDLLILQYSIMLISGQQQVVEVDQEHSGIVMLPGLL